jgi:hypothetical protein
MDFDPIAQLTKPGFAATLAFIIISTLGFIAYRLPATWSDANQKVYLRAIGMAAEVFVAIGIIGLVTFAGRAKLDSNDLRRIDATRNAETGLSDQFHKLAMEYCIPLIGSKAPTANNGVIDKACKLWHEHAGIYLENLDWKKAQDSFTDLASVPNLPPSLRNRLSAISTSIETLREARHLQRNSPLERKIIYQDVSSDFILFCSVIAGVGIALKWAKAAHELRQELAAKRRGRTER